MNDAENSEQKSVLKINVTNEQRDVIRALFGHYDWKLEELNDGNNTEYNSVENNNQNTSNATEREGNNDTVSGSVDNDIQSGAVGQIPDNVCVHCFCDPCVTINPQAWLGNGQNPHPRNSEIRKRIYKKFWKLMNDRNAFSCPHYIQKKSRMLARVQVDEYVVTVAREIMPDCVLSVVRGLYPNPSPQPYMGHKWL